MPSSKKIFWNGNADLPILCKVYYGMTEAEEALLFAMQAGDSAALTPSAKLRANLRGEDKASSEFYEATEDVDLHVAFERGGAAASFTASAAMNPISFMRRARRRRNCAA